MIGIIVARDKNGCIGKEGNIPWRIKGEQLQFKELTTGNCVIMGRKSYEEIGHPLPNRMNIVVSRTTLYEDENLATAYSLDSAISKAKELGYENIYISGGAGLFKEGLPLADKLFITEVDLEVEGGDTFFPSFDESKYDKEVGETGGDNIKFTRVTYTKNKELELDNDAEIER